MRRFHSSWTLLVPTALLFSGLVLWTAVGPEHEAPSLTQAPENRLKLEGNPDEPDRAMEYFWMERLPDGRDIDVWQRYQDAERHMATLPRYSSRQGAYLPAAREAGPADTKAGSLESWDNLGPGNIGGRTRSLLIDPDNPDVLYAGGVTGGVWKSIDGGETWRALADLLPNITVGSLAMDPSDSRILYAGTGEATLGDSGFRGAGIFKSVNAGKAWTRLDSTWNKDFRYVNDIVVSVNDPRRLYAATHTGVWRSRNRGNTWVRILDPQVFGGCLDLAQRTDMETDVLFASCGTFDPATVYRHAHAETGMAWEAVISDPDMGRTSLAIAPSDQDVVYALASSLGRTSDSREYKSGLHAVFRSTGGGVAGSWQVRVDQRDPVPLNTFLLSRPLAAAWSECANVDQDDNDFTGQGWWDNVIAVDPVDPDVVYVGGIDLFRSDDGGSNWGLISYWWHSPPSAHADQHAIVFHPDYDGVTNRSMFVANDGGLWRTDNPQDQKAVGARAPCNVGLTQVRWKSLNTNYAVTQFYHGVPFPSGRTYFGGTQDNGTILGTDEARQNGWHKLFGGDGGYVAVDPHNTDNLFISIQWLALRKSTDGGLSFRLAIDGIDADESFPFIVPYTMDPRQPRRLWLVGQSVWRTTNAAERWHPASPRLTEGTLTAVAVAPTNPNRVVVGDVFGAVYRNDRALKAGRDTEWPSARLRSTGTVSWLAFDPFDDDVVYATVSTFDGKHVFRSVDGAATWEQVDGNGPRRLPNIPVHSIVVDPDDRQRLFVGTDRGVFVSTTGGKQWAVEDNDFTHAIVQSMSIVPSSRGRSFLFAFTYGRGAWRVELE